MKKGFTLLELLVTVLLGAMIMLMIAGVMSGAIRSWESVQVRVSENYNRRNVLDLLKRQSSSLFFRQEANDLAQGNVVSRRRPRRGNRKDRNAGNLAGNQAGNRAGQVPQPAATGFNLPDGAHFFKGNIQEVSFLSTVSFLSDFPGQVAVRYYVVQGDPGEDSDFSSMPSSRSTFDNESQDPDFEPLEDEVMEELEGDLYLYVEEKNLFLSMTQDDQDEEDAGFENTMNERGRNVDEFEQRGSDRLNTDETGDISEVIATSNMRLIGPLRKFTVQYRIPAIRKADDAGDDEDWEQIWDVDKEGIYPSAIEFILVYEVPNSEDVDTEDLPGIRMVIPVYDTRNLARGVANVPF